MSTIRLAVVSFLLLGCESRVPRMEPDFLGCSTDRHCTMHYFKSNKDDREIICKEYRPMGASKLQWSCVVFPKEKENE